MKGFSNTTLPHNKELCISCEGTIIPNTRRPWKIVNQGTYRKQYPTYKILNTKHL